MGSTFDLDLASVLKQLCEEHLSLPPPQFSDGIMFGEKFTVEMRLYYRDIMGFMTTLSLGGTSMVDFKEAKNSVALHGIKILRRMYKVDIVDLDYSSYQKTKTEFEAREREKVELENELKEVEMNYVELRQRYEDACEQLENLKRGKM